MDTEGDGESRMTNEERKTAAAALPPRNDDSSPGGHGGYSIVIHHKLARHIRSRLVNDLVALGLVALGLAGFGVLVVAAAFWSGWVVAVLLAPLCWLAWRRLRVLGLVSVAREVEREFPEVEGRLLAALQLAEYRPGSREGYSAELVEAAVADVEQALRPLHLERLVPRKRILQGAVAAVVGLGVLFGYMQLASARARVGLLNGFAGSRLAVEFIVEPGDTAVLPGEEVTLRCRVEPAGVFGRVMLEKLGAAGTKRAVRLEDGQGVSVFHPKQGFAYRFRVLSRSSEEFRIRVIEPLEAERLVFSYRYPEYTGLPEYRSTSTDIVALKGTAVEFEGEANQPLGSGRLILGRDTTEVEAGPDRRFRGEFTVTGDGEGRIELTDAGGGVFQQVGLVRVRSLPDESPLVRFLVPGRDTDLPASMQVLLGLSSLDDFGLGGLYLYYGRDSIDQRIRIKDLGGRREDTTLYAWDLARSGLLPGDVMQYYAAVLDNDVVSGPKMGRTPVFQVRFPTMVEIYNASVQQTEHTAEELAPLMDQQERISEEMARISEQMKRSGDLSWEERKALEQVLSEQTNLAQEIAELREDVSRMMDEMLQGMTLDEETMERMAQLQELLSELLPRELQESLARLREELEQGPAELRDAIEQFELDQEQLKAGIEQALEMLERVLEEQRLEELARKAEELADAEAEILERLGAEEPDAAAKLQDEVSAGLDSLLAEMEDLAGTMSDSATADSLAELGEQAEQDSLSQLADEAGEKMQQGKNQQAKSSAGKLQKKLQQLSEDLSSLSMGLKRKRSDETAEELAAAAEELLMISREQEELETGADRDGISDRAAREMSLHDATGIVAESLASLAGRSMSVSGRLIQELTRSMRAMKDAAGSMVESRTHVARRQMATARAGLNRTVAMLLSALASERQGGGFSGGMEALLQQLSQMSGEQMAINAGMGGMPIPLPGGMSDAQVQALGGLFSRQQALRQKLEQMLQSLGGETPGLTSSLEGLLDEMKAVEQDMAELNVSRDLVERQESILSHLLDTQRSIQQRGRKEQRESEGAKPFQTGTSPRLPEDMGERNRMLREELMRSLKQKGFGDYEQMIRLYFERLLARPGPGAVRQDEQP